MRGQIRHETILTPPDLERMTGARAARSRPIVNDRMAAFGVRTTAPKLCVASYFAGGTTHPGGGVPMVMLSGKLAAEIVLADFAAH